MSKGQINAIYRATEGEGVHLGRSQVFVRFQGCTIGCANCDSKDTWDFTDGSEMTLEEVLAEVHREGLDGKIRRVSITGGDPLHPKHVPFVLGLVKALKKSSYEVVLEAAGVRVVHEIFDRLDFINIDFKTPSTQVTTKLSVLEEMLTQYPGRFQVKAVVADRADFEAFLEAHQRLSAHPNTATTPWVITPCYEPSEPFPLERFTEIMTWNDQAGGRFRVIGQQHKWLFGPDKKRV